MFWWKWLDNLDLWSDTLEPKGEEMFGKIIEAVRWSWSTMTLISIVLICLFSLFLWALICPVLRKKIIQGRHRRKLNKDNWDNDYARPEE